MRIFTLACVLLAISACHPATREAELPATTILFDRFYTNYAWGFGCSGCYIDKAGGVHHYNCTGLRDTLALPEWQGREEELLRRRFHMSDSVRCHIDKNQLAAMRAMIGDAAKTPPAEPEQVMADAGATSFTAYAYDSKTGARQDVLLGIIGDWTRHPSSSAAEQIIQWLDEVCPCENNDSVDAAR